MTWLPSSRSSWMASRYSSTGGWTECALGHVVGLDEPPGPGRQPGVGLAGDALDHATDGVRREPPVDLVPVPLDEAPRQIAGAVVAEHDADEIRGVLGADLGRHRQVEG